MNTRTKAEQVAATNLAACASAVLAWQRTGRLDADSALHKVAAVWGTDPEFAGDSLQQAERTVTNLALQLAAAPASQREATQQAALVALAERVAGLNARAGEVGAGMLAQLVDQAHQALAASKA